MDPRYLARCPSSSSATAPRGKHRRAHSETLLRLPDDLLLLDPDVDFPSLADLDFPSLSDDADPLPPPPSNRAGGAHLRSLSVDASLFENLGFHAEQEEFAAPTASGGRHARAGSIDEAESLEFPRKAMAAEKLAELSLIDPKRAKRILANRQSAARSKERKVRYTGELEKKVQTLQTEATTLSAQVTLLQKDTSNLTVENKELKLRLDAMEQQAHLRDALNEALREEVQRLRIATGQIPAVNGNAFHLGIQQQSSPYFGQLQQMCTFSTNQTMQLRTSQLPSDVRHHQHNILSSFDAMDLI